MPKSRFSRDGSLRHESPSHFSVQQYLKSNLINASFPEHMADVGMLFQTSLSESSARASIATVCLSYLSHFNDEGAITHGMGFFSLYPYSTHYWMEHARAAESNKELIDTILKFFLQERGACSIWALWFEEYMFKRMVRRRSLPWRRTDEAPPLYYASCASLRHIAEILIDRGADVNVLGGEYGYPLVVASSEGQRDMVALLLKQRCSY